MTQESHKARQAFVLDDRLRRNGRPFVAVGVNYHPTWSGFELLSRWQPERLRADFREIARRGCNTVRFFVPWREVEPAEGRYDELAIGRLGEVALLADDAGLACIPALLTIFMNGELLDLPWRGHRDLWTDATMRSRAREYVIRVALELRPTANVLAYDLGDELLHIAPEATRRLTAVQARSWLAEMAKAVREADPGALVMQGNEASAVFGDHPFGVHNAAPLDLLAVHGFPLWSPVAIESTSSFEATLLPAFLARFSCLFGHPLTDELGAYAVSEEVSADYLRAAGHSALANGSLGVLAWLWQDVDGDRPPYDMRPRERSVGLLDRHGQARPAMAELELLARHGREWSSSRPAAAPVAVFVPQRWRPQPGSYLEASGSWPVSAFYAFLLLKRAHLQMEFADRPLPHHRLLVCPSVEHLTLRDHRRLAGFVGDGGTVLFSSGTVLHGLGDESLFGVRPYDFSLDRGGQSGFEWNGVAFPIDWGAEARLPLLEATDADVLASFPNGRPALTRRRHGTGAAFYLNAPFERQLDVAGRLCSREWHLLYDSVAAEAGIVREVSCDSPSVELQVLEGEGGPTIVVVNHASAAVTTSLELGHGGGGDRRRVDLAPKAVEALRPGGDPASAPARR